MKTCKRALRGHLAEFGFVSGALPHDALLERMRIRASAICKIVSEAPAEALPELARAPLSGFIDGVAQINRATRRHRKAASGLA